MARTKPIPEVVDSMVKKKAAPEELHSFLFPTGSKMLNLACGDSIKGGFIPGTIVNVIGDSSAGKSFLQTSMCAELCHDPFFDDYDIIYDDIEHALVFDIEYLFGKKTLERIRPPAEDDSGPVYSDTIEELRTNVISRCTSGRKFVYIVDSLDGLTSLEEKKTAESGDGSYNMQKPRIVGQVLRMIVKHLKDTQSLLIIVSQTRDNIGFGAQFKPKTRSGGRALEFYASHVMWMSVVETLKKNERKIGVMTEVKVTKNRNGGKPRDVRFPIYYDFGIDDIGACIDFMCKEGVWKAPSKAKISVPEFDFQGSRSKLIEKIEEENLERKLFRMAEKAWRDIEESLRLKRKSKFE